MEQIQTTKFNLENNSYSVPTTRPKFHRTVAKGLKLLTQILNTIQPKNTNNFTNNSLLLNHKNELPHDVFTYEILARLPIKSLLRLKSVSKEWCDTVSSYEFANVHFKTRLSDYSSVECLFIQVNNKFYLFYIQGGNVTLNYSLVKLEPNFEENDVQLVGSCNGLVCLANFDYFYLWNPATYQSRKFSDFSDIISYPCDVSWGFGYVSSVDDYMVVKIIQDYDRLEETVIHVFSLHSKGWKRVQDHGLDPNLNLTKTGPGVFFNDSVYWIMVSKGPSDKRVVVRFNLVLEKFEELSGFIPRGMSSKDQFLCVVEGYLCMYSLNVRHEAYVSILKGSEELESVRVSGYLDKRACSGLVGSTRTGKCFVVSKGSELGLMDLNGSGEYFHLVTVERADRGYIVGYVPSLISPFCY